MLESLVNKVDSTADCEIFNKTYFQEDLRMTASVMKKRFMKKLSLDEVYIAVVIEA